MNDQEKIMERKTVDTKTVSLKDLWHLFLQRAWIMAIAAVAAVILMFAYVKITFVPKYQSTATVYILSTDMGVNQNPNNDFTLALTLVQDCNYILKSHAVLDEVAVQMKEEPGFEDRDYEYAALAGSISINNPADSRILEITVRASSPEEAKVIVDKICDIGSEKIQEAMRLDQVNVLEYGTLQENPYNVTGLLTYLLVGLIAAIAVYGVCLVIFVFDDRIGDNEQIEQYLNLTVLGDIPDVAEAERHNRGYYYKRAYSYSGAGTAASDESAKKSTKGAMKNE